MSRCFLPALLSGAGMLLCPDLGAGAPTTSPLTFKLGVDFRVELKQVARSADQRLSLVLLDFTIERSDEGSEDYAEVTLDLRAGRRTGKVKVPCCQKCAPVTWGAYVIRARHVDNRPPGAAVLHVTASAAPRRPAR